RRLIQTQRQPKHQHATDPHHPRDSPPRARQRRIVIHTQGSSGTDLQSHAVAPSTRLAAVTLALTTITQRPERRGAAIMISSIAAARQPYTATRGASFTALRRLSAVDRIDPCHR